MGQLWEGSANSAYPSHQCPVGRDDHRAPCPESFLSAPIMEAIGLWLGPAQHDSCSMTALSLP